MKLALLLGVCVAFITSCFTAGYDAKPGTPKNDQYKGSAWPSGAPFFNRPALLPQFRKSLLAHYFINQDRRRVGQVERADFVIHWDPQTALFLALKKTFRNALRLSAENKKQILFPAAEIKIGIMPCSEIFDIIVFPIRVGRVQLLDRLVFFDFHMLPVIQPCTPQHPVICRKTERVDEMKRGICPKTRSGDISGICRDFRLV